MIIHVSLVPTRSAECENHLAIQFFQMLLESLPNYIVADHGHKHSNGISNICFSFKPRRLPPGHPAADELPQDGGPDGSSDSDDDDGDESPDDVDAPLLVTVLPMAVRLALVLLSRHGTEVCRSLVTFLLCLRSRSMWRLLVCPVTALREAVTSGHFSSISLMASTAYARRQRPPLPPVPARPFFAAQRARSRPSPWSR